jgi:hypothetical protein
MKKSPLQLEWVEIAACVPNEYQAAKRTSDQAIKKLKADIEKHGIQTPPKLMRLSEGQFVIVDGHRRIAAARELGLTKIQATIFNGSALEASLGFIAHASVTRKVSGSEIFYAYALACQKKDKAMQSSIFDSIAGFQIKLARFEKCFGRRRTIEVGLTADYSVAHIDLVDDLLNFLSQTDMRMPKSRKAVSKRAIGEWCIKHKVQAWLSIKQRSGHLNRGETGFKLATRVLGWIERDQPPPKARKVAADDVAA